MELKTKDPDDILDYERTWDLEDGDTITTSSWFTDSTELVVDSDAFTSTTATVWLSGGTHKSKYRVTNRIVTAAGRQMDLSFILLVREK